jgi:hypothetical protein
LATTVAGDIYTIAGNGNPGTPTGTDGDGGPAINAQIDEPYGVAVDTTGHVYVADAYNNRVRAFTGAPIPGHPGLQNPAGGAAQARFHHSHRCSGGPGPSASNDPGPC